MAKSSQTHLLTHGGSGGTPVHLRSSGSTARRAGAGRLGARGRPGGRGGRRPGRVQYWRGKEQHCTASRPSGPPGARDPAPHRPGPGIPPRTASGVPGQPQNRGRAGELGPAGGQRLGAWARGEGTAGRVVAEGRPRWPGKRLPAAARACALNTRSARRGAVAMVTRVPATRLNGCCLATPGQTFWGRPLRCSAFLPRAGRGLRRPSDPRAPLEAAPPSPPPGRPPAPRPRGVLKPLVLSALAATENRSQGGRNWGGRASGGAGPPSPTCAVPPNVSALRTSPPSTPPHIQPPGRHHVPTRPQLPSAPHDSLGPPNPIPSPHLVAAAQVRHCPGPQPLPHSAVLSHIPPRPRLVPPALGRPRLGDPPARPGAPPTQRRFSALCVRAPELRAGTPRPASPPGPAPRAALGRAASPGHPGAPSVRAPPPAPGDRQGAGEPGPGPGGGAGKTPGSRGA